MFRRRMWGGEESNRYNLILGTLKRCSPFWIDYLKAEESLKQWEKKALSQPVVIPQEVREEKEAGEKAPPSHQEKLTLTHEETTSTSKRGRPIGHNQVDWTNIPYKWDPIAGKRRYYPPKK
jgi:hypothetical protein